MNYKKRHIFIFYPFLDNLLSAYKEFDKELENNDDIYTFYNTKVTDVPDIKEKYKDIFLKLLRNLRIFAQNRYKGSQVPEYCTYFYHWLYLKTKEHNDANFFISIIFNDFLTKWGPITLDLCPYSSYNKQKDILESNDLVKLSYYKFNYEKIKDILKERKNSNYCLCQKYLDECVSTYRTMKASHCSNNQEENNKELCSELTQFYVSYLHLTKDLTIGEYIPDIYDGKRKLELLDCPSEEISKLRSDVKTLPTAFGTIAGATSVLALLYKFTPAGTFLHARIRGGEGRINNSDYADDVKKSVFGGVGNSYDNSYNIGYETM
ncbi:VIR protein [Plasmodium vivax]|uniref:VIR protein n=1 Tax=Plasmodium vivax TaxID=5855 RepID=A0A1G4GS99_PLAVI|nr:VIR protein [Plasmodium vivax]